MDQPKSNIDATDNGKPGKNKGKRVLKIVLISFVAILAACQLVPVERSNPPIESDISAPAEVKAILKRSCYGCHSHETTWPWYSYIAPASWLVAHDVEEAREELNFSTWDRYSEEKKKEKISECWEEVEEGEMPLWFYLPLHPEARLTENDLSVLRQWAGDAGAGPLHSHDHASHDDDSD